MNRLQTTNGSMKQYRYFWILAVFIWISCSASYPNRINLMDTPAIFRSGKIDPFAAVAESNKVVSMEILYATDRETASETDKETFYANRRGHYLRLGKAVVRFGDEDMTWSDLKRYSLLKSRTTNLPIQVKEAIDFGVLYTTLSLFDPTLNKGKSRRPAKKFAALINEKLHHSKSKDIYIYTHGFKVNFENPILVASELWHYMGEDGVFLAYSWPSTAGKLLAYASDLETAAYSARNLRLLLKYLAEETEAGKIHILAYSAGTRVVTNAITQLRLIHFNYDRAALQRKLKIGNVILMASDFDRDIFRSLLADGFIDIPQRLTIYISKFDKALSFSNWFFSRPRLGETKGLNLRPEAIRYLEENDDLVIIDVSDAENAAADNGHGYFRKSPWASSDVIAILRLNMSPAERGLVRQKGNPIWRFPPGYIESLKENLDSMDAGDIPGLQ